MTHPVTDQLWDLDPRSHAMLGSIRIREGEPTTRIWSPQGAAEGLAGAGAAKGGLIADDAGVWLLRGRCDQKPVPLPPDTALTSLSHYPMSSITAVLIVRGVEMLARAAAWADEVSTWERFAGAVPIVGWLEDPEPLGDVSWPAGVKLLTRSSELAATVAEHCWGMDVEVIG